MLSWRLSERQPLPCPPPCLCADGLAALHRTGLHFFALAYCGSNLREVSCLLKACHLSASRAAGVGAERPLAQRSILGGLLPGEQRGVPSSSVCAWPPDAGHTYPPMSHAAVLQSLCCTFWRAMAQISLLIRMWEMDWT